MYMSPEIALGDSELDHRTDVFSLGIMLFEILTHRFFFEGEDFIEIKKKLLEDPFPLPREIAPEKSIPKDLQAVCMQALKRNKEERYPAVTDCSPIFSASDTMRKFRFTGTPDGKN